MFPLVWCELDFMKLQLFLRSKQFLKVFIGKHFIPVIKAKDAFLFILLLYTMNLCSGFD